METNNSDLNKVKETPMGYLALPFSNDQFKDFVASLLGTPQTITKYIKGNFTITKEHLINIHRLIQQRIIQQNKGSLLQLKTEIYYSDESSVILNSIEEFATYNEIKPIISEAIRMTWSYLIIFEDKTHPEKQEIELMIIATPQRNEIEGFMPVFFRDSGLFQLTIKHTARSWGSDIESLLTNHINSIITKESKYLEFIKNYSEKIGLLTGLFFFFSSLIGILILTNSFIKNEINTINDYINKNLTVNWKVDYLLNYIAQNNQNLLFIKCLIFIIISIIFAITLGIWVESLADNKTSSFLLLTDESSKNKEIKMKQSERKMKMFWVSLFVSIVINLFSNYLFEILTKKPN